MEGLTLAAGARRVIQVCAGVRPGETVLVLSDTARDPEVAAALYLAAVEAEARALSVTMAPPTLPVGEPPAPVALAMAASQVVVGATTCTIYHTRAVRRARKRGARVLSMPECTPDTLRSPALAADFDALLPKVREVARALRGARDVLVTAPGGTRVRLSLRGRSPAASTGLARTPGSATGVPDVEVLAAPVERLTEGELVCDGSASILGRVQAPVRLIVRRGRAVEVRGGEEARRLSAVLQAAASPSAYVVAEFALGLNPLARVVGSIIEDEGAYGTGHFALGDNSAFGGRNRAPIHVDLVFCRPTVTVDGRLLMMDGCLVGG
ncbi:MAG: aminopeptidase [Acetobacteraceae bacterium]|nr:aminopeptidase [Acetobacteraceae bacterium]